MFNGSISVTGIIFGRDLRNELDEKLAGDDRHC
jgi:hypothetical protein